MVILLFLAATIMGTCTMMGQGGGGGASSHATSRSGMDGSYGKAAVVRRTTSGRVAMDQMAFNFRRPSTPAKALPRLGPSLSLIKATPPNILKTNHRLMAGKWWFDLRTGKEIGGGVKDVFDPSFGGDNRDEGGILRFLRGLIRRRTVQLLGLLVLAGGGITAMGRSSGGGKSAGGGSNGLLSRGSKRPTERFVRPAPEKEKLSTPTSPSAGKGGKKGDKAPTTHPNPSTAKPIPEAHAPIPPPIPPPPSTTDKTTEKSTPPSSSAPSPPAAGERQEPMPSTPPPTAEGGSGSSDSAEVIPPPEVEPEESKITERQRWTPFRNLKSKMMKKAEEANKDEKAQQETEKIKGEKELGALAEDIEKQAREELEGLKKKAEAATEGEGEEEKGATKERDEISSTEEEEEKAEGSRNPSKEKDDPFFKGNEFIDRRGSVLASDVPERKLEQQEEMTPSPSSSVSIPVPGQLNDHPRHGSSFVSSVFRNVGPAVPRVDCVKLYKGEVKFASGSGVIFTPDGYLVTNSLLVRNALELKVTMSDGREYAAEVKGSDEVLDIAVLKILKNSNQIQSPAGSSQFEYAPIGDSDALQVGDWVMSIGSPKSPGPSVILGIVSGLTKTAAEVGRPETQVSFIQTDASFDSGVVGGPLVNEYGEVVGINSIGMTTSSTVQFSVPINQVKDAITDLANGKAVMHPSIGVEMMPVTPTLAAQLNQQARNQESQGQIHYIPEGGAVVVVNVLDDSPAQVAGLKNLDILLEIDRRPIYKVEDAQVIIKSSGVGRDLEVKVLRRTQEVTLRVRTTDFLSLFRKQQASRRYPELTRKGGNAVEKEQGGGKRGDGASSAGNEEQRQKEEVIPAPSSEGGNSQKDVDQPLKGHLFVVDS